MKSFIEYIFQKETGFTPTEWAPLQGGFENIIYRVNTPFGDKILRLNKNYFNYYLKEKWAMEQADLVGVPVPSVHAVGEADGFSYILLDYIDGIVASAMNSDTIEVYHELGRLAQLINGIPVEGYGLSLSLTPKPHFRNTWPETFYQEMNYIFGSDILTRLEIITASQLKQTGVFLEPMRHWDFSPRLSHNDIHPDNAILGKDGKIYLIDWARAQGQPAPYSDVGNFLGASKNPAEAEAFLTGYGFTEESYRPFQQDVDRIRLIYVLRGAVWAAMDQPHLLHDFTKRIHEMIVDLFG